MKSVIITGFIVPIFISCTPLYTLLHTEEHRSAHHVLGRSPDYCLVKAVPFPSSRAGPFPFHSYGFTSFTTSAAIGNIPVRIGFKFNNAPHYYSIPFQLPF
ncbi:BZ3500_MvSof-1268-A1-R1_Chr5-1g07629 [Microbotryum saponariae]|uniref:BZ3500_MvSof-1268-A1-R1_Chr5-1g07629 protein n=1 Tax=Microbotryum saponariae TaxID=289078 RepID=A0A2X0LJV0_9BASI|nr:BZ3500_MvSof-1268-A1-R1_Chr5-1g07629 [Microbotryum saponariae]SDA05500.1 BZ3501_MvSof-1269-A2-R1_Chr5-2g07453 [Microbotryum saponariae]